MAEYGDKVEVKEGDRVIARIGGVAQPGIVEWLGSNGEIAIAYPILEGPSHARLSRADVAPGDLMRIEDVELVAETTEEPTAELEPKPEPAAPVEPEPVAEGGS